MRGFIVLFLIIALAGWSVGCGDSDDPETTTEATNNEDDHDHDDQDDHDHDDDEHHDDEDDEHHDDEHHDDEDEDENNEECDAEEAASDALGAQDEAAAATLELVETDGVEYLRVDASVGGTQGAAESSWVYVNLVDEELVEISDVDAFSNTEWTIALKRADIRTNSGNSGPRSLLMASVEADFDSAGMPGMDAEWSSDDFIGEDCEIETFGRSSLLTAFGQWYDYNPETHEVSAPENVTYYLYDPGSHAVVKFAIVTYDDGVYDIRVEVPGAG